MPAISDLFVDPEILPDNIGGFIQLLFLMCAYAYFLNMGSHYISDGSELLLLVPSIAGIVGSVVLPVLGAVPDGAIVTFSGLGPDAQKQLNIGVGALAGSTVMLLTLPWALCIFQGRVDLDAQGQPIYKRPANAPKGWTKLTPNAGIYHALFKSGIIMNGAMRINSFILIATSLAYLLIQIPAFVLGCGTGSDCARGAGERYWALAGFFFTLLCFIAYLVYQVRVGSAAPHHEEKMTQLVANQISEGHVNVASAFFTFMHMNDGKEDVDVDVDAAQADGGGKIGSLASSGITSVPPHALNQRQSSLALTSSHPGAAATPAESTKVQQAEKRLKSMLRRFFKKYDHDGNGFIDQTEFHLLMADLNIPMSIAGVKELFSTIDRSGDSMIDYEEFCHAVNIIVQKPEMVSEIEQKVKASLKPLTDDPHAAWPLQHPKHHMHHSSKSRIEATQTAGGSINADAGIGTSAQVADSGLGVGMHSPAAAGLNDEENPFDKPSASAAQSSPSALQLASAETHVDNADSEAEDEDEEEEEEVPEDLKDLTPEKQQSAIKFRAAWMMTLGTVLILLFSDPMVDCLSNLGERIHVPGFYVAFLLAPLAANASELLAAVTYAAKKTPATITISITSLEGSGTMNNTFCLMIFLMLVFAKNLIWQFSAETITILVVELVVALLSLKQVHRGIDAVILLSLYPLSMALVAILENVAGIN